MEINSDDFKSYDYYQTKEKYFNRGFKTTIYVEANGNGEIDSFFSKES